MSEPTRVLFLCTGNSCRSHMAEGFLRSMAGDRAESLSAGAAPAGSVHPKAIEVMSEVGVDISEQSSKHIDLFLPPQGTPPDVIVAVCSSADENCPVFPADVRRLHWPFDDPAHATGSDAEILSEFRRVRDEIQQRLTARLDELIR